MDSEVSSGSSMGSETGRVPEPSSDDGSMGTGVDTTAGATVGSGGASCGNGVIEGNEQCDGVELAGADCVSEGFGEGRLGCGVDCTYDTAGCMLGAECGDGVVEGDETCDGNDLAGEDCLAQGFLGGVLSCRDDCSDYDTSNCSEFEGDCCTPNITPGCADPGCVAEICATNPFCCAAAWDNVCAAEALAEVACQGVGGSCPELGDCCSGNDTPGCEDAGCTAAICGARPSCCDEQWDAVCAGAAANLAACQGVGGSCPVSLCGDDFADPTEVCDGTDLVGNDCTTQGFDGGQLGCMANCAAFDSSACANFAGDCCTPHMGPGCNDADCSAAICALLPFCCDVIWDGLCADAATAEPQCLGTSNTCPAPPCGDGVAQVGEPCDGIDLGDHSCVTQGFEGGPLACQADCLGFDTSACADFGGDCCQVGGNGTPGCEASDCTVAVCAIDSDCCSVAWDGACATVASNELACQGVGGFCPQLSCGDNSLEGDEVCDGANLAGQTCNSVGFAGGGTLACQPDCAGLDTSGCFGGDCCTDNGTPGCNDATCTGAVCATDPACCDTAWTEPCATLAVAHPACAPVDSCPTVACGNNQAEVGEACDGTDLAGEDCASQGFGGGPLACQGDCLGFDVSGCFEGDCCSGHGTPGCDRAACTATICATNPSCCDVAWDAACAAAAAVEAVCQGIGTCPATACGNDLAQPGELCDGTDLPDLDCVSQGFVGGTLACAVSCLDVDTSGCFTGDCCTANGTPGCDDVTCAGGVCTLDPFCCGNTWDGICVDQAVVAPACQGIGTCPNPQCGDQFAEGIEVCDGADLAGQDCVSQGFGGGTLSCLADCTGLSVSACFTGDCCADNGSPGCIDQGCTAAICALGPSCCDTEWDGSCAAAAAMEPACQGVGGSCPL